MEYYNKVFCEVDGSVATVTLNIPPVNALDAQVMDGLDECFTDLYANKNLRAVIITGAGRSFVAGADIKEFVVQSAEDAAASTRKGHRIFNKIEAMPCATIAAVNGFAFGGGLELALVCDIRLASEKAKLGLTETSLGIVPGYGGLARLAKVINIGQAKKMIFTAEHVNAQTALEIGLVQEVLPVDGLMDRARELAAKIAKNGPIAVRQAKYVINATRQTPLDASLDYEAAAVGACFDTADKVEGVDAFINKRDATFNNK